MKNESFFQQINSKELQKLISGTKGSLCYAAPGIQVGPATSIVDLSKRIGCECILVFLDVDESVLRMGYGDIEAITSLEQAGIVVQDISGLRNGLIISDDIGYSYTPTALFLEREAKKDEALNAIRLLPAQIREALARLSPASKAVAIAQAETPEEKSRIESFATETKPKPLKKEVINEIAEKLRTVPPVKFDVARQVRVFQPHFQYVELSLTGAAIQRHKLTIPKVIQNRGAGEELEGRLRTTFDLIDKDANVSSKALDKELRDIRDKLTRSLGQKHGRIIRKGALPRLEKRLDELRAKIENHQKVIKVELEKVLKKSKEQVVSYFLPLISENPPDELYGIFGKPTEEDIKSWLEAALSAAFPDADSLIKKIQLEVYYKDVTFDTLNRSDFLESIKFAYPEVNWDKTYQEFRAAGESK